MKIALITGGVRSGKSAYAERLAAQWGGESVVYLATGQAWDDEMAARIERHRNQRPAGWQTWEEPLELERAVASLPLSQAVLLDTLSGWIANLLCTYPEAQWGTVSVRTVIGERVQAFVRQMLAHQEAHGTAWVIVSDEVGLGGVAATPLGRAFQDAVGEANQRVAAAADQVVFVAHGLPLTLKGGDGR